jgi:hypothetical protein
MAAFWYVPIWPEPPDLVDDDDDWNSGLVNFGLDDITNIPGRFPDAIGLRAIDVEQARIEAAQLWHAAEARGDTGRRPDGYDVLDAKGFVMSCAYFRGKYALE